MAGAIPRGAAAGCAAAARSPEAALAAYVAGTVEALAPCSSAILVSRRGELLMERYDRGPAPQSDASVNAESLWPFWSVTKSFSAAAVARLAGRGVLSFGMPLSAVLPEFGERGPGPFDRREVSLAHLMSHTSGCALPGRTEDGVTLGPEPDLRDIAIATKPGAAFEYSSLGMHLLERTIEAAAGRDYGELLRETVLEPFGLSSMRYLFEEDLAATAGSAAGNLAGASASPASRALPCSAGAVVPSQRRQRCGLGLYGTARDLLSFGERWLTMADASGTPWCDAAARSEIWTPHSVRPSDSSDYGLLWWLFGDLEGVVASGASFGLCALLPRRGIAVAVARNHIGPTARPFDYRADKRRILELAREFA
ncbi:beta-lactamase family protein [bacterium]|nr:beta-lactamase family protein [bacterium]